MNIVKNGIHFKGTEEKPTMVDILALNYLDLKALEIVGQGFKNGNISKNTDDNNKFTFTMINNQLEIPKVINKITSLMVQNKEYICTNKDEIIDNECVIGEIIIAGLIINYLKDETAFDNLIVLLGTEKKMLGLRQLIVDRNLMK